MITTEVPDLETATRIASSGFVIFNIWDDVLYLSGITVDAGHQQMGHVEASVAEARFQYPGLKYLALRTQPLRMYVAGSTSCNTWIPTASGWSKKRLRRVGTAVAERINSVFPVHVGCYGGPLYGEKPTHQSAALQQFIPASSTLINQRKIT